MTQAIVNGKKQDIIITSSFKNSEFDKLGKKLPYSVLEYLFVNKYKYLDIKKCLDNNAMYVIIILIDFGNNGVFW